MEGPLKERAYKLITASLGYMADGITSRYSCGGKLPVAYKAARTCSEKVQHCTSPPIVMKDVESVLLNFLVPIRQQWVT